MPVICGHYENEHISQAFFFVLVNKNELPF